MVSEEKNAAVFPQNQQATQLSIQRASIIKQHSITPLPHPFGNLSYKAFTNLQRLLPVHLYLFSIAIQFFKQLSLASIWSHKGEKLSSSALDCTSHGAEISFAQLGSYCAFKCFQ